MSDGNWIGDEQIARVKAAVDLVAVVGDYSALRKSGSNYVACCPIHHERTPSLQIYTDQQTWHCYGCARHGDAITLVMELEHLEFSDAVELLGRRFGVPVERRGSSGDASAPAVPKALKQQLADLVEFATAFYVDCLWSPDGAAARDYLTGRGFTDETIRRFRVGWAPGHARLVQHAKVADYPPELLQRADLAAIHDARWSDRFFDRITFPILDRFDRPVAFSARALPEAEVRAKERGTGIGKYVNTTTTAIYTKGSVVYNLSRAKIHAKARGRLVVVEGQTGVMAADQVELGETVAVLGTALTADHVKQLGRLTVDGKLVLCFDGDDAGRASSLKAVRTCLAAGVPVLVATLKDGADPAELLIETRDAAAGRATYEAALAAAVPDLDYLLAAELPDPKVDNHVLLAAADSVLTALAAMPDPELRELHLRSVAKHFRLEKSLLKRRPGWPGPANPSSPSDAPSPPGGAGERLPPETSDHEPIRGRHDQGNAERFIARHGKNLRFCFEWNCWLIWAGTHWKQDTTQEVHRLVVETITTVLPLEAAALRRANREWAAEDIEGWMQTSLNQRKIEAVLIVAQKEPGVGVSSKKLNQHQWLFAAANGTIDLRTGQLREASRDDLITRCSTIAYRADAVLGWWTDFLKALTLDDADLTSYLQRAAGYSMSGSTREEVMFLIHGPGQSGKSTFMAALETVLGDYAATIDFEMFLATNVGKRETYYATIEPSRLVQCEESGDGKRFAEDVVKKVTGGNRLQARHLYGAAYDYIPRFKVWMVCNDLPRVSDTDTGFWRRVQVIACTNVIPKDKRNRDMKEWLRADAAAGEALLAWMVAGAAAYYRDGLAQPEAISRENALYRLQNDPMQEFLDEHTGWSEHSFCFKANFAKAYQQWCETSNSGRPLSNKAIIKRLRARGASECKHRMPGRASGPVGCWKGFRLLDEEEVGSVPPTAPSADGTRPVQVPDPVPAQAPAMEDHPQQQSIDMDVSHTSGPAIGGTGQEAVPGNLDASPVVPRSVPPGQENPARPREGTSLLDPSSPLKRNTGFPGPVAHPDGAPPGTAAPPPTYPPPLDRPPRGQRMADGPDDDEDRFLDLPPF